MDSILHNGKRIYTTNLENGVITGKHLNAEKSEFIIDFTIRENELKIYFLKVFTKREGLGSKVLCGFEKWARKNKVKKIYGDLIASGNKLLTPVEDLKKFYAKNKFKVDDFYCKNNPKIRAKISKHLMY